MLAHLFICLLIVLSCSSVRGDVASADGATIEPLGKEYTYKVVDGRKLHLYVLTPGQKAFNGGRPAFVSFHGGGWTGGLPAWFNDQSSYLTSRGMVSVEVEYRLLSTKDEDPPIECIEDAKSAIRWVRSHAKELHIDPHKIAAAGGSAGGQMVAFAGLMHGFDDPSDDLTVSARPDAMILFNPAFIDGPGEWDYKKRVGNRYLEFFPFYHVASGAPPTLVMSGMKDVIVPHEAVVEFCKQMVADGNVCITWLFPEQPHGFFNQHPYKDVTILETDRFLVSLGWLQGQPTMKMPSLPASQQPFAP